MDRVPANLENLRFHWRLPPADEQIAAAAALAPPGTHPDTLLDFKGQLAFCRMAERYGIDSLLTMFNIHAPDPVVLVSALIAATTRIQFMLAHRPGLMSPTAFVQQVNTIAALAGGRLSLNVVMGHSEQELRSYGDFLAHDERYRRAEDFVNICRSFWERSEEVNFQSEYYRIERGRLGTPFVYPDRTAPEIYVGGGSPQSREIAARHADCWLRLGAAPEAVRADAEAMRARGVAAGIRLTLLIRPTHEEAVRAAYAWVAERDDSAWINESFIKSSDSTSMQATFASGADDTGQWPAPWLWTGAVRSLGPSAVCLIGTPEEIATAIGEYQRVGVTQFIFSGWPDLETLQVFGEEVLPLVRASRAGASVPS